MFNFDNIVNVTNKQVQLADLKVFSNNKIRVGEDAKIKLNLINDRNIIIQKTSDGQLICASTAADSGNGRPLNKNGEFSHQTLSHLLGGQHSEWTIVGEGVAHPQTGDVYYELKQTVDGKQELNKLAATANEVTLEEEEIYEDVEEASLIDLED